MGLRDYGFLTLVFVLFSSHAFSAEVPAERQLILGKVQIFSGSEERTKNCTVCFSLTGRDCYSLKNDGKVVTAFPPGMIQIQRAECTNEAVTKAEAYVVKGAAFRIDPREKVGTYFGDLTLTQLPEKGVMVVTKADDHYAKTVADYHHEAGKAQGFKYVKSIPRVSANPEGLPVVDEERESQPQKLLTPGEERNRLKPLYVEVSLGYPIVSYSSGLTTLNSTLKNSGSAHYAWLLELGLLFPFTDHETLFGGVFKWTRDSYSISGGDANINILEVAASFRYYLIGKVGDGLFFRGDIGFPRISTDVISSTTPSLNSAADTQFGLAFTVGAGYDLVLNPELKLGFGLDLTTGSANYEEGAVKDTWRTSSVVISSHLLF